MRAPRLSVLLTLLALALAACGSQPAAPTSPTAPAATAFEDTYRAMNFEQIAAAARGQTVNWHMWGGSDAINAYVNGYVAEQLKAQYDITLKQVPVTDIAETVNKLLAEKQAGKLEGGSVDLMWINGENFRTLKEGESCYRQRFWLPRRVR
jgi:putative spermidine/putrescine transport system substrate-binding protein